MTRETKTFISTDEIIGLSVECRKCGVKSVVGLESELRALSISERTVCPHCNERWFVSQDDPVLVAVMTFVSALIKMRGRLKELDSRKIPLGILLEITSDEGRASRDKG